jgi:replicative DNA helicase
MTHECQRPLPASLPAERATLGAILLEREAIVVIAPDLDADDFVLEKHAAIYRASLACYQRRIPPDLVNVADELRRGDLLEAVGGLSALAELVNDVPSAVHVEYYAGIVARTAVLRRLIEAGGAIAALGYGDGEEIDSILERAEQVLTTIRPRRTRRVLQPLAALMDDYLRLVRQAELGLAGLATGYADLDALLGGLLPGQLIILGGRPGQGKTALALSMAYRLISAGFAVDYLSLEMSREELIGRLIGYHCGIGSDRQFSGTLSDSERTNMLRAAGVIAELPLRIDDSEGGALTALVRSVRQACIERMPDLVIVDYLQLIGADSRERNRTQVVDAISRGLKALARELRRPILALAALSRAVEGRVSKIPTLADLRESGSIEADADKVLFVYRAEVYGQAGNRAGIIEVHIAKHRNGPLGVVPLQFNKDLAYVQDLEQRYVPQGYVAG